MKSKIYILLAIGILMFSAADLNAQVKGGSFSITPVAGYSIFPARSIYEDTETYGLAVGYNFSERFGIEGTYNVLDTEIVPAGVTHIEADPNAPPPPPGAPVSGTEVVDTPGGASVDAYQYGVDVLFYIYPGNKFAPYAVLGFGMGEFKYPYQDGTRSVKDHNAPLGFGFKYFVTDMIAVRADLRAVYPFDQNNIRATAGVTFQLGGK